MTEARISNSVWVTWLAKYMAGEVQCGWAPWFRSHYIRYARAPGTFQLAQWQAEHNFWLHELVTELRDTGHTCRLEGQNDFTVKLSSTLTLAGKPDLVATDQEGTITVYDLKTGTPRPSDTIQVVLYMLCLPSTSRYRSSKINGCVVYKNGPRVAIPFKQVNEEFRKLARHYVNILDGSEPPAKVPSLRECGFCDISAADCTERLEGLPEEDPPELQWGEATVDVP